MQIINSMAWDLLRRILSEACDLVRMNERQTIRVRDMSTAAKLILGTELAKVCSVQ